MTNEINIMPGYWLSNEKWYLYNHFITTFLQLSLSYSHYVLLLSFFFSLYYFGSMKREQMKVVIKVVSNGYTYITTLRLSLDWRNRTERSGMEHNGMERNEIKWNRESIPLFGYSMMEWNKFTFPLFGKLTKWNEL